MPAASATGFYGKLPCRGDFIQRRVPADFLQAWDGWLQECLHASRGQLGERWLEAYLTSPVWRFVLAEGIGGESAYAGVMLPSVDRVGRYFPLTLICPLEPRTCLLEAACESGRGWFDAAEALALKALEASDLDVQAFDAEVDALPGLGACAALAESNGLMERLAQSDLTPNGSPWRLPLLGDTPQRAANAFASIEMQRAFRPCALWWSQGSEAVQPQWLVTSGLPPPAGYVALLAGQWREAGWNGLEFGAAASPQGATPAEAVAMEEAPPPDLRIEATHPAPQRTPGATAQTRYIVRPEIGLWGIVAVDGGAHADACADLITDVAHDLAPQAALTTLAESARRALDRALGSRTNTDAAGSGAPAVVLLLAGQGECALLWSGSVRAVRIRDGAAVERVSGEPAVKAGCQLEAPAAPRLEGAVTAAEDDGLLALLAAPASAVPAVGVRYDELHGEDLWVLGGGSIPEGLIGRLASTWPGTAPTIEAADSASPLLLVTARLAERTVA